MRVAEEIEEDVPHTVLVPEYRSVDWTLLTLLVALVGFGLVMVFSASIAQADRVLDNPFHYWHNQLMYIALG